MHPSEAFVAAHKGCIQLRLAAQVSDRCFKRYRKAKLLVPKPPLSSSTNITLETISKDALDSHWMDLLNEIARLKALRQPNVRRRRQSTEVVPFKSAAAASLSLSSSVSMSSSSVTKLLKNQSVVYPLSKRHEETNVSSPSSSSSSSSSSSWDLITNHNPSSSSHNNIQSGVPFKSSSNINNNHLRIKLPQLELSKAMKIGQWAIIKVIDLMNGPYLFGMI